jgi:acyl carrier protein
MIDQGMDVHVADRRAEIRDVVADVFSAEPGQVEAAQSFAAELEVDSLLAIELLTRLEKHFGVTIPEAEAERMATNLATLYQVVADSAGW